MTPPSSTIQKVGIKWVQNASDQTFEICATEIHQRLVAERSTTYQTKRGSKLKPFCSWYGIAAFAAAWAVTTLSLHITCPTVYRAERWSAPLMPWLASGESTGGGPSEGAGHSCPFAPESNPLSLLFVLLLSLLLVFFLLEFDKILLETPNYSMYPAAEFVCILDP